MNQEVIRDFLNVPGIVGIALLSGHSEPVFYTHHSAFTKENPSNLLQSVFRLVETIPAEYDRFEFHFAEHQIALHRLQSNRIVLVIKNNTLNSEQFISAFNALASEITANPKAAIEQFQPLPPQPRLKDLLETMNDLSQFTTRFLGIAVITNYWKSSRPEHDWLQQFQVDRAGQISFLGESSMLEESVSAQQLEWIRDWGQCFIRRCSQAVRGYATLVEQQALTDLQKALLLP
ncbi:MAG: hypothetical protein MUC48_18450 [Leptolyngbya sp. Prado105]|jgi:hypothetical protein|nr:hypothetical protein [Leptolyngbya sp. Prado105]